MLLPNQAQIIQKYLQGHAIGPQLADALTQSKEPVVLVSVTNQILVLSLYDAQNDPTPGVSFFRLQHYIIVVWTEQTGLRVGEILADQMVPLFPITKEMPLAAFINHLVDTVLQLST